jgi:hypothetical protein
LPGSPGAGVTSTRSCVISVDAPGRSAENERLAGMRLEDHLLVELAHAHRFALGVREEDAVEAAVGNGAGVENGQPRRAVARCDHVADAVPGQPRAQLGELVGGVAAAEQVEHALEGGAARKPPKGAARRTRSKRASTETSGFGGSGILAD